MGLLWDIGTLYGREQVVWEDAPAEIDELIEQATHLFERINSKIDAGRSNRIGLRLFSVFTWVIYNTVNVTLNGVCNPNDEGSDFIREELCRN